MGLLDDLKKKREIKRAETDAYLNERARLAPETGRLKAKADEDALRARRKEAAKGGGKKGGLGAALGAFGKFGEESMRTMGTLETPAMREMGYGGSSGTTRKKRTKKEDDPWAAWRM